MTRIIQTTTPGKERTYFSKAIVVTIRELLRQKAPDHNTQDMLAFIILALEEIASGIDQSVAAWEKRDYWVKADKYRMQWRWTGEVAKILKIAFKKENWKEITSLLVEVMGNFKDIKVSDRHRMGKPWLGAHEKYLKEK